MLNDNGTLLFGTKIADRDDVITSQPTSTRRLLCEGKSESNDIMASLDSIRLFKAQLKKEAVS